MAGPQTHDQNMTAWIFGGADKKLDRVRSNLVVRYINGQFISGLVKTVLKHGKR